MREITQEEFDKIYADHRLWLETGKEKGKRADFSNTDLTKIKIPKRANLSFANFVGADLSDANLSRANLIRANLSFAILSNANLLGTNFWGADLEGADLEGADLRSAILERRVDDNSDKQVLEEYQRKINSIERDKISLLSSNENKDKELADYAKQIANLQAEQKRIKEEQEQERVKFTQKKEDELDDAFGLLEDSNCDIEKEITRLNGMFDGYIAGVVILASILTIIWIVFYSKICSGDFEKISYVSIWLYVSPSVLLVGFIWGAIVQAHRAQRQLVALRKYTHKIKQIKAILQAYIKVIDDQQEAKAKINEMLSAFANHVINEDISIDKEESSIKANDKKDNLPYKQALDAIVDISKRYKS